MLTPEPQSALGTIISSPKSNNQFYALRHGQSRANVQGIICSNPEIATRQEYGLSDLGSQQAQHAGKGVVNVLQKETHLKGICILSSDFARALETAEAVRKEYETASATTTDNNLPPLLNNQIITDTRLRERWFGTLDMQSDEQYKLVWEEDAKDSSHCLHQVESVDSVRNRASQVVNEYNSLLQDYIVIIVAHGDVLQILQTAFLNMDARKHRSLDHLETATLRRMDPI